MLFPPFLSSLQLLPFPLPLTPFISFPSLCLQFLDSSIKHDESFQCLCIYDFCAYYFVLGNKLGSSYLGQTNSSLSNHQFPLVFQLGVGTYEIFTFYISMFTAACSCLVQEAIFFVVPWRYCGSFLPSLKVRELRSNLAPSKLLTRSQN